ncbi:MAG: hypothetical protein LBP75_05095, partial [Planctomycetota bacterium]|nr:hypothetical protein [Planctomycetota bacterium]
TRKELNTNFHELDELTRIKEQEISHRATEARREKREKNKALNDFIFLSVELCASVPLLEKNLESTLTFASLGFVLIRVIRGQKFFLFLFVKIRVFFVYCVTSVTN